MYLVKKNSKNGKIYFVLVVKTGFMVDNKFKSEYVNLTYSKGLELAEIYKLTIYEDKKEEK